VLYKQGLRKWTRLSWPADESQWQVLVDRAVNPRARWEARDTWLVKRLRFMELVQLLLLQNMEHRYLQQIWYSFWDTRRMMLQKCNCICNIALLYKWVTELPTRKSSSGKAPRFREPHYYLSTARPEQPVIHSSCINGSCHRYTILKKVTSWSNFVALSPQANNTEWATATFRRNLVPTFVDRWVSHGQRGASPAVINLSFLDGDFLISFLNSSVKPFSLLLNRRGAKIQHSFYR
jgi:hypothetical protein